MIRFSKYIWLYFIISGLVLVPGTWSLVRWGLRPAVDFTGGTLLELRFANPLLPAVVTSVAQKSGLPLTSLQQSGGNSYLLRLKPVDNARVLAFQVQLATASAQNPQVVRDETVGPILGQELLVKAMTAAIIAILAILAYVAYAFRNIRFGVAAILALFHDLLVVVGCFSLLGKFANIEVDTLFVTAFLTTMSFSVHDTIVVFDRIREYLRRGEKLSFEALCDRALTETMGRSLSNSLTIVFMLVALILLGGDTVRWFIVALLIGTVSGTYSSDFVATPILILWHRWDQRRKMKKS